MHTVELLEEAIAVARRIGYQVRHEWFGGSGGGACEIKGRKAIFLDLALDPADQLEQILGALRREPLADEGLATPLSYPLRELLQTRKIA